MLGSSVAVQLVLSHLSTFRLQMFGMTGAVIGISGVVMAWHLSSLVMMIVSSFICGAAIGMAYLGSITEINMLAKPEERGQVNSLYFVIVYLFFSIPTIGLGFVATHFGLYNAVSAFAGIIIIFTIMEMVWLAITKRPGAPGAE
jgi:hypothetical protein